MFAREVFHLSTLRPISKVSHVLRKGGMRERGQLGHLMEGSNDFPQFLYEGQAWFAWKVCHKYSCCGTEGRLELLEALWEKRWESSAGKGLV